MQMGQKTLAEGFESRIHGAIKNFAKSLQSLTIFKKQADIRKGEDMKTSVRTHRILSTMANYKKCGPADDWILRFSEVQLGEPIGCYRNTKISTFNPIRWKFLDFSIAYSRSPVVNKNCQPK